MMGALDIIWILQQLTGATALGLSFYAVFRPSGKKIMFTQALAGTMFTSHYLLNGLTNLAFISFTGILANLYCSQASPKNLKRFNLGYSGILISCLIATMTKPYHVIPVFICVLCYFRAVSRDNLHLFLLLAATIHISWAAYHAFFGTYYGMMNDSTLASLNLIALYHRTRQKNRMATATISD